MARSIFSPHASLSLFRPRLCHEASCERERGWRRFRLRSAGVYLHEAWYCSPDCLQKALRETLEKCPAPSHSSSPLRRIPLGLMMFSRGQLTAGQLHSALAAQCAQGGPLGGWLEKLGYASEQQVTAALGLQWACPVLPALAAHHLECARMLPFPLLQHLRMLPVWHVAEKATLCVAFSDGVDYAALNAVGEMLGCRPEPCLVSSSAMNAALEQLNRQRSSTDIFFESDCSAYEIARIIGGYCHKLNADQIRLANFRRFLWARLTTTSHTSNLLFRLPAVVQSCNASTSHVGADASSAQPAPAVSWAAAARIAG